MESNRQNPISRRNFIKIGSTLTAGGVLSSGMATNRVFASNQEDQIPKINVYRTFGRTGFKVSDISMGSTKVKDANVYRYAYDHGINYFDNAEGYSNGDAERNLGKALKHMERPKVFITTKLHLEADESEESIISRFRKCMERLDTDYVDCLYMHGVKKVSLLDKPEFHSAVAKLKADGKLRFCGISSHGPRRDDQDSMEKVLTAAALDGRFDAMLLIYNFMNQEAGNNIIEACKQKNVGTSAMKTSPGILKVDDYNPDQPTEAQLRRLNRLKRRYDSEDEINKGMQSWIGRQRETHEKTQPFIEKHGIKSEEELRFSSIRWILQNQDMQTTCISFSDFDLIDKLIPYSGRALNEEETGFLNDCKDIFNDQYCRHGCTDCMHKCPHHLPVSTIMRYAYYYKHQGRQKEAMKKYAGLLKKHNYLSCIDCDEPCIGACTYNVDIPSQLVHAHNMLSFV